ncbi:Yip1 family protein [Roseococcus sp. SYP-B2431]|uniref:Yip1 family protein n=1 Tax=Roseococcus sp. SYP-B2431 TaxID=2496640 RepID=UPI0013F42E7E|nr:Yip1 family protein [Roseococcus sp. SYP-B2431]
MDIVSRAKGLLTQPQVEWNVVAAEPADVGGLFTKYVVPLSAIPAIAGFIGAYLIIGAAVGIGTLLVGGIVSYILGLVGIFVLGKIIEFLGPKFGGPEDGIAAMKLAAYAPTASWVAGIFLLLPVIGAVLALIGALYSIYLFYLGAPIVARVPPDRAIPFTIAVFVVALLVNLLIGAVVTMLY